MFVYFYSNNVYEQCMCVIEYPIIPPFVGLFNYYHVSQRDRAKFFLSLLIVFSVPSNGLVVALFCLAKGEYMYLFVSTNWGWLFLALAFSYWLFLCAIFENGIHDSNFYAHGKKEFTLSKGENRHPSLKVGLTTTAMLLGMSVGSVLASANTVQQPIKTVNSGAKQTVVAKEEPKIKAVKNNQQTLHSSSSSSSSTVSTSQAKAVQAKADRQSKPNKEQAKPVVKTTAKKAVKANQQTVKKAKAKPKKQAEKKPKSAKKTVKAKAVKTGKKSNKSSNKYKVTLTGHKIKPKSAVRVQNLANPNTEKQNSKTDGTTKKHDKLVDQMKLVNRRIHIKMPGNNYTVTQSVILKRSSSIDDSTGQISHGAWNKGKFDRYVAPKTMMYQPKIKAVPALQVDGNTPDLSVDIPYEHQTQTKYVSYLTSDAKVVGRQKVSGWVGYDRIFKLKTPAGYKLVNQKRNTREVHFDGISSQAAKVYVSKIKGYKPPKKHKKTKQNLSVHKTKSAKKTVAKQVHKQAKKHANKQSDKREVKALAYRHDAKGSKKALVARASMGSARNSQEQMSAQHKDQRLKATKAQSAPKKQAVRSVAPTAQQKQAQKANTNAVPAQQKQQPQKVVLSKKDLQKQRGSLPQMGDSNKGWVESIFAGFVAFLSSIGLWQLGRKDRQDE